MKQQLWIGLLGGLLASACLVGGRASLAEEKTPEGVEILGRGPVHEAFAQPLEEGEPQAGATAPKPPPIPPEEQPPEQKPEGDNVQWMPGYWQWDDERGEFVWVTGVWREPPPNRKWVPGEYRQTENGYQWSPGFWGPESKDSLEYLPPPPATVEAGPSSPAPSEDCTYVPGCWVWRDTRYAWRPGYWLRCRPDWIWQPAHYVCTSAGYLFVSGYWDYPLEQRGVLFAPVCFARPVRSWCPSYTVSVDFLPGALFVRTSHRHYYYGDYFTAGYRRAGFTPWVDYRVARHASDPLWGHYRTVRADRPFERDLRGLYTDRFAGRADRPPRTLGQQSAALRNGPATRDRAALNNVTVLRPLAQAAPAERRLVEVNRAERDRQQQQAAQLRQAANQRVRAERELIANREVPTKSSPTPRRVEVNVPRVTTPSQPAERGPSITAPPRPRGPEPRPGVERSPRELRPAQPQPRIERPEVRPTQPQPTPRIETPQPRPSAQPRIERPEVRPSQPSPRIEMPQPRPAPQTVTPRMETPRPRQDRPAVNPQPQAPPPPRRIEAPRQAAPQPAPRPAPAPRMEAPRAAPPRQAPAPAPRKAAPPPSRPAPAVRSAPAPAARPAPAPAAPRGQSSGKPAKPGKPR